MFSHSVIDVVRMTEGRCLELWRLIAEFEIHFQKVSKVNWTQWLSISDLTEKSESTPDFIGIFKKSLMIDIF